MEISPAYMTITSAQTVVTNRMEVYKDSRVSQARRAIEDLPTIALHALRHRTWEYDGARRTTSFTDAHGYTLTYCPLGVAIRALRGTNQSRFPDPINAVRYIHGLDHWNPRTSERLDNASAFIICWDSGYIDPAMLDHWIEVEIPRREPLGAATLDVRAVPREAILYRMTDTGVPYALDPQEADPQDAHGESIAPETRTLVGATT